MTNADSPRGFYIVRNLNGSDDMSTQPYTVDAANVLAIGIGDPITLEADGNVKQSVENDGVAVGAVVSSITDTEGFPLTLLPTKTAGKINAFPVGGKVFGTQADSGTAVAATDKNATANFVVGAVNTLTGFSTFELDSSDIGTGNQLRILNKVDIVGNDWGEHVDLEIVFVENAYNDSTSI